MCPVTPDPKHMRSYLTVEQPRESAHEGRIKKDVLYYYEKYQKHRPFKPRTYKSDDRIDCLGGTFHLKAFVQEFIKNQEEKEKMKTEATKTLKKLKVGDKVRIRKDLEHKTYPSGCYCKQEMVEMLELVDYEPQDCQSTPPAPPKTPVIFTREELNTRVVKLLEDVIEKFKGKNASYGDTKEGFYNFKATAERFSHLLGTNVLEAQFNDALILFDKHWVTLAKNGINDPECEDRLGDMIVYGALMSVMKQQQRASEGGNEELEELEVTETPPIDLLNMTYAEAKEALRQGKCTKIQCKQWELREEPFICLEGSKFLYRDTTGFSEEVIEGYKNFTDSSKSIWYAID